MGAVYLARRGTESRVLKFMNALAARDTDLRRRFAREWDVLRRMAPHPNVVGVHEVHDSGDEPFIVMEHVDGESLQEACRKRGRLPAVDAARIARDVARGLAAIHTHGILHRDIKPANVMLAADLTARIVDFGLAKDLQRSALTQPGQLLGTAHYMAPEQWEDAPPSPGVDLFSLGATLYHSLVGNPPFEGEDMYDIADLAASGQYDLPSTVVEGVSLALERVLVQLLEPNARYRYRRAAVVADDLERAFRGEQVSCPHLSAPQRADVHYPLVRDKSFTIGSDPTCPISLSHESVAPRHAQVRRRPAGWYLCDLRSPSGTYVRGERVEFEPRPLHDGDLLRVGAVELCFRDPREAGGRWNQGR
jgi:serine/threonine protein kinase